MRTVQIGSGGDTLEVSRLAYGCMRIAGTWNPDEITPDKKESAYKSLEAAYEAGYSLFDHADIYCRGGCEKLHGDFLKSRPELKERTILATKCGIKFRNEPPGTVGRYEFSRDHILWSCDRSLERLATDRIDIYQLHRPDLLMNPEEVAEAFSKLKEAGKVRMFGVSNFFPSTVELLQKWLPFPIVVNQIEVSFWRLASFFDGTLDQCIRENIVPLSWSPLGGGKIGKEESHGTTGVESLAEALGEISRDYETDETNIALAWLMKHPSGIVPIVGSVQPERIRASTKAIEIDLSREEWYRLFVAARGEPMP